jgi:hypothetical protein
LRRGGHAIRINGVDGAIGDCKSEASKQPVPLDSLTVDELQSWRKATMYASDMDWVFASERVFGKMPIWSNASLQKVLQPAACGRGSQR